MSKLLKPLDNGKKILSEKEVLADIEKVPAAKSPENFFEPAPRKIFSDNELSRHLVAENSIENNFLRTQNDWIDYFNATLARYIDGLPILNSGKLFASLPAYYNIGKKGRQLCDVLNLSDVGTLKGYVPQTIRNIRSELNPINKYTIMTSTYVFYSSDSLDAKIVHNHQSKNAKIFERECSIPMCHNGELLEDVLQTNRGGWFIQSLLCTDDCGEDIIKNLRFLFGKKNIKIYTPDLNQRRIVLKVNSLNAGSSVAITPNGIYLNGNINIHDTGIAREVIYDQSKKNLDKSTLMNQGG